ncbi:hypothetical protein B0H11DRAFT_2063706 [Mycena galericulata]|nr:hypothetical protein B0H11DRAFT_2063706 [Mycena galericulata]
MVNIVGSSWLGFSAIRNVVIFGDSLSWVGRTGNPDLHLTLSLRLGAPFPGHTASEPDPSNAAIFLPNWVGHLVQTYTPDDVMVFNYAVPGTAAKDLPDRLEEFKQDLHGENTRWGPWSAEDTLFVSWIGANSLASAADTLTTFNHIRDFHNSLHSLGGRNFALMDVPPALRTPKARSRKGPRPKGTWDIQGWNTKLNESAVEFAADHNEVTMLCYSTYATWNTVLDDPLAFGLDPATADGGPSTNASLAQMWSDDVHPSGTFHNYIARDFERAMSAVPPYRVAEEGDAQVQFAIPGSP